MEGICLRDKLRAARIAKNLSGRGLARLAGLKECSCPSWENGNSIPNVRHALRLARALDTTVEALFVGEVDG